IVAGIVVQVDEQVSVNDSVDVLPGVLLQIDERVAVKDAIDLLPAVLLNVAEPIAVSDEVEAGVPDNTPTGTNVFVPLRDPVTGRVVPPARFPIVSRSGRTAFTSPTIGGAPAPRGFRAGVPPIVYDVTTTATFDGQGQICIDDSLQQFARLRPHVFHFEG